MAEVKNLPQITGAYGVAAAALHQIGTHPEQTREGIHNYFMSLENIKLHYKLDAGDWYEKSDYSFYDLPKELRKKIESTIKALQESNSEKALINACRACTRLASEIDDLILGGPKERGIALSAIPQTKEPHTMVYSSMDQLKIFFAGLRQDSYSEEKLREEGLFKRTEEWLSSDTPHKRAFYMSVDDPDDLGRNDEWGSWDLFECLATTHLGEIHLSKTLVKSFSH